MSGGDDTLGERAAALGLSDSDEIELEQREPWIASSAARYGRGAENMRAWLAAGRPAARRDRLCVSGTPITVRLIRAVVDRIPEPAAWHLVETTAITWIPPGLGFAGPWPTPPPRPEGRIDMGFTVDDRNLGLVMHEVAHRWHRDPELFANLTSAEIEMLDDMVRQAPGAAERGARSDESETAADSLATLWLGVEVSTSATRERARRLLSFGEDNMTEVITAPEVVTTPEGQGPALDRVLASFDDEEREAFERWFIGLGKGHVLSPAACRNGTGQPCNHETPCLVDAVRADMCRDAGGKLWILGDSNIPARAALTPIGRREGHVGGKFLVEAP